MNYLRSLFYPTREEEIKKYEQYIELYKRYINHCTTCLFYNPTSEPGYIMDYGSCEKKYDRFFIVYSNRKKCPLYCQETEVIKTLESRLQKLKNGEF